MNSRFIHRLLLEGVPMSALAAAAGVALDWAWLALVALLPLVLWLGAAIATVAGRATEARRDAPSAAVEGLRDAFLPLLSTGRAYAAWGLWRNRYLYDASAVVAFVLSVSWLFRAENDQTVRLLCAAAIVVAAGGALVRYRGQVREPPSLFTDVMVVLDGWEHKRRRLDELSYESAIAARLRELGFHAERGRRLDDGREADIVVRPENSVGPWNWRDVMIEMKAHLTTTNERDRALGQLKTYSEKWPGAIVLMICGDHRRDFLQPLNDEVAGLRKKGRAVAMVVKGRACA